LSLIGRGKTCYWLPKPKIFDRVERDALKLWDTTSEHLVGAREEERPNWTARLASLERSFKRGGVWLDRAVGQTWSLRTMTLM